MAPSWAMSAQLLPGSARVRSDWAEPKPKSADAHRASGRIADQRAWGRTHARPCEGPAEGEGCRSRFRENFAQRGPLLLLLLVACAALVPSLVVFIVIACVCTRPHWHARPACARHACSWPMNVLPRRTAARHERDAAGVAARCAPHRSVWARGARLEAHPAWVSHPPLKRPPSPQAPQTANCHRSWKTSRRHGDRRASERGGARASEWEQPPASQQWLHKCCASEGKTSTRTKTDRTRRTARPPE